jgi:hypothetical protein
VCRKITLQSGEAFRRFSRPVRLRPVFVGAG